MTSPVLTPAWWKAAALRALRTAVVIAVPYVPTLITGGDYGLLASAAGFGALLSLITSIIKGIPEAGDTTVPWYFALLERVTKTTGQALLTAFGAATLFQDVHWAQIPAIVATAALGSLLIGVLGFLPEADAPVAPATVSVPAASGDTNAPVVVSVPAADTVATPVVDGTTANSGS